MLLDRTIRFGADVSLLDPPIRITRELMALDVIDVLSDLFRLRGVPGHIRSDNEWEFIAEAVRDWIAAIGSTTALIEPGSPWEVAAANASTRICGMNTSTIRCSRLSRRPAP